jgi:hypothetical protein
MLRLPQRTQRRCSLAPCWCRACGSGCGARRGHKTLKHQLRPAAHVHAAKGRGATAQNTTRAPTHIAWILTNESGRLWPASFPPVACGTARTGAPRGGILHVTRAPHHPVQRPGSSPLARVPLPQLRQPPSPVTRPLPRLKLSWPLPSAAHPHPVVKHPEQQHQRHGACEDNQDLHRQRREGPLLHSRASEAASA